MNENLGKVTLSGLRNYRDEQLAKGQFGPAETTQQAIDKKLEERGETDETAALEAGRDERLHPPIDDVEELETRRSRAEYCGFAALAEDYAERIDELTPDEDEEPSEAALEEQKRAALAEPNEDVLEQTEAALGASDVVEAAERGQPPTQYVYDAYGHDPRDFDDEYELRAALRDAEPKRLPKQEEEISTAEAALSVGDRNRIAARDTTAAELIEREYGLDPDDYDDVEELRAAIHAEGGFSKEDDAAPSRKSAFSDPNDWV